MEIPFRRGKQKAGRIVESAFKPHPLLASAHLQTIVTQLRRKPELAVRCERLELADGDYVDLGWSGEDNAGGPLAVLVHGMAGNFDSHYLLGTARELVVRGWRTVMLKLRGAGAEPNRSHRHYNQADTEDVRHVWQVLRAREPEAFIASVGWSLGANLTLKAMGEEGAGATVDVAAAACAPFTIRPCAERLRTGFSKVYQKHLLELCKEALKRKSALVALPPEVDLAAALAAEDFIGFDDACTSRLAGYAGVDEYYDTASCGQYLKHIGKPTLVVHALDDPFMTEDIVPAREMLSPWVTLEVSPAGGHVGFIGAGQWGEPTFWLESRLADWLHEGYEAWREHRERNGTMLQDIRRFVDGLRGRLGLAAKPAQHAV